jgi:hypothetical protein
MDFMPLTTGKTSHWKQTGVIKTLNTTLMAQSKDTKRTLLPKDIHKLKVLTILKPFHL